MSRVVARIGFAAAALGLAVCTSGCTQLLEGKQFMLSPRVHECEGFDVPLSVFIGPSRKELRAKVRSRHVDYDLPFVVETTADTLTLIGFTPLGTKSFTLVRTGDQVVEENLMAPAPMGVPPKNVMSDVLAMSLPSPCAAYADGVVPTTFDKWIVSDTCKSSRPEQRNIARVDAKPGTEAEIQIDYRDDGIVVQQKHCRYNARYVLQVSAPIVPEGVNGEDEE